MTLWERFVSRVAPERPEWAGEVSRLDRLDGVGVLYVPADWLE